MKKTFCKITAILLLAMMLLCLTSCGKTDIREIHHKDVKDGPAMPAAQLNAAQLYQSIAYTPEMFMGRYYLKDGTKAEEEYLANSGRWSTALDSYDGEPQELTLLPMAMRVGPESFNHKLNNEREYVWGEFHFLTADGKLVILNCAVEVKNNNTLCITPVETLEYDEAADRSLYTLADTTLEYQFAFRGTELTLTNGGNSVTLNTAALTDYYADYGDDHQICVEGYLKAGSPRLDNIEVINFLSNDKHAKYNRFYLDTANEETEYFDHHQATGYLGEDGLFTFSYTDGSGTTHSYQALYFYLDVDGMILYDGAKTYYYTGSHLADLEAVVAEEDADRLADLSETAIQDILVKKASLFDALTKAFADAGIAATVDPENGEISIDSAVLFDVNKYDISAEGQAFLTDFWNVYTSVLSAEEYTGFLQSIVVEGHADPSGSYDDNMVLSENRAASVRDFCEGIGGGTAPLESVGYSSSRPVLDETGEVDYDASRRVAFRFCIAF